MSVTIVIPTIGSAYLRDAVISAIDQTYSRIDVMVIIDGQEYKNKVYSILEGIEDPRLFIMTSPHNTGSGRRYGHSKYASSCYLTDSRYVSFLDEDNTYDTDHIKTALSDVTSDVGMIYSYRKIIDNDGKFICYDDFESVGMDTLFCDTSTMIVRRDIARKYSYRWTVLEDIVGNTYAADRLFSSTILKNERCRCSLKYTVNYRTEDRLSFFSSHVSSKSPLYLYHFNSKATRDAMSMSGPDIWKDMWQLTLVPSLRKYYTLYNGYEIYPPEGSNVLFICCFPEDLPLGICSRNDIKKYIVAMESPNHMHIRNFDEGFLGRFSKIITYNTELESSLGDRYEHMLHPINIGQDHGYINTGKNDICCILANRQCQDRYTILGVELRSLEYLRYAYASNIHGIHCYGRGWNSSSNITAMGYSRSHPADVAQDYTFSLIIENNNAEGGITEKIYMALMAGSIPLYYYEHGEIPNIPNECWINIYGTDPSNIMDLISSVDIDAYRNAIYRNRADIFSSVSPEYYASRIRDVIG